MSQNGWEIESIRLTIFGPDPPSGNNVGWWKSVTGVEPESVVGKPALGMHAASGVFSDVALTLSISAGRVDWLIGGVSSEDSPLPVIGSYAKVNRKFHELFDDWLQRRPLAMQRIAYGLVGRIPVADKIAGYKRIAPFLPSLKIDPTESSDLLYQVNRPRKSKVVPNLTINRLSKWTVGIFSLTTLGTVSQSSATLATFCRLELDLSTDSLRQEELGPSAVGIAREFGELASEIMDKGDIS